MRGLQTVAFGLMLPFVLTAPVRAQDGGAAVPDPTDEVTEADRAAIRAELDANRARHGLPTPQEAAAKATAPVPFGWPVALVPTQTDPGLVYVSAHVDQDRRTEATQDFACGTRTYDQHEGTDFATWPWPMIRMDQNHALVVAAAPGWIVGKRDGNFDRHCSAVTGAQWNAVYIQHYDGSVAWYGHLKSGSLTSKGVGEAVVAGERLGVIGSSGRSTGPHLHLEVYDPSGALQDPYAGSCNYLNRQTSWWAAQRPYVDPGVNAIRTGIEPPTLYTCPDVETVRERRTFQPGQSIVTTVYLRDLRAADRLDVRLVAPDGSTYLGWSHTPATDANRSYWYYTRTLRADAPTGQWNVEVTFGGQTHRRAFAVGEPLGAEDDVGLAAARLSEVYPNPFGTVARLDGTFLPGERVRVDAFDALGRRVARLHDGVVAGGETTLSLDTRTLAPGAYTLRVTSPRGTTSRLALRR